MLLKDLDIRIEASRIDLFANLVIKREDKHYQIPIRIHDDFKSPLDISPARIRDNIQHFIATCENYSKRYKLMTEEELGSGRIKFTQEEITL